MSEKVYPDWVQKQKTVGATVKKVVPSCGIFGI